MAFGGACVRYWSTVAGSYLPPLFILPAGVGYVYLIFRC